MITVQIQFQVDDLVDDRDFNVILIYFQLKSIDLDLFSIKVDRFRSIFNKKIDQS